jgi:two-component system C4-dicarboxylate transport sensor histidine kinase DctB
MDKHLSPDVIKTGQRPRSKTITKSKLLLFSFLITALTLLLLTNSFFTSRFGDVIKRQGQLNLTKYTADVLSELQKNSVIPQLLVNDKEITKALISRDFSSLSDRFSRFVNDISIASITLLDKDINLVAFSAKENFKKQNSYKHFLFDVSNTSETLMSVIKKEDNEFGFFYSQNIEFEGNFLGVILIEVDLKKFENAWSEIGESVFITDSTNVIILSTEPSWKGLTEEQAFQIKTPQNVIKRAYKVATEWSKLDESKSYFNSRSTSRHNELIQLLNWNISSLTKYSSVRERVNTILAFEILLLLFLVVSGLYFLNRKNIVRLNLFEEETVQLKELNKRLTEEIKQRKRVEKNLLAVEQTLEQHSKLAALGEMSAAISHELNQPLAAMKTYLAGASLLLKRNRPNETVTALMRIDDLIQRMGGITKQLKSFSRKNTESFVPLNFNDAFLSAMAIMEPQLKQTKVKIETSIVNEPIIIMGDQQRLEQVIINLLRNAIDAVTNVEQPEIKISLYKDKSAILSIGDNGIGISNLETLFEPFQTTKDPGKGLGLGLAISSNIISELGGMLQGKNLSPKGAEFQIVLPLFDPSKITIRDNKTLNPGIE